MNKSDIGVYVTVDAVFPAETPNAIAMCAAIAQLSRDDALFTCARINAIVSGFGPQRDNRERQRHAMSMICSPTQIRALDEYAARHGGAERVMVFFRGQLLELARWVARYGENEPGDGETFADPAVRSSFLRAALIASGLWEQRLFGIEGRKPSHDPREQLRRALGAFRKSVEEANRAPHPGFAISRGWLLFSQYLPARLPRFADLFRAATGLTIQQYFVSAFAIMERTFSDRPEDARIFNPQYVQGDTPFRETFEKFVQLQSQTPEDWAQSLRDAPTDSGYRSLRMRPVLSFTGNRSIIFDPTFYIDNLTTAPLFHVLSGGGVRPNEIFSAFGFAFEDYSTELLRKRYPTGTGRLMQRLRCGVKGVNAASQEFEVDALLNDVTAAVVFEMKAAWIREETILNADPETFLNEVRKKYGYLPESGERPKGVAQLARIVGALARREWTGQDADYAQVTKLYPVLTVYDGRMAAPGSGRFLDDEFRTLLGSIPEGIFVHPLIVMTIADLEYLVSSVETLSLEEFLRAYSTADPDRVSSVHNFIATSEFLNQVRASPVLMDLTEQLMQAVRSELSAESMPNTTAAGDSGARDG